MTTFSVIYKASMPVCVGPGRIAVRLCPNQGRYHHIEQMGVNTKPNSSIIAPSHPSECLSKFTTEYRTKNRQTHGTKERQVIGSRAICVRTRTMNIEGIQTGLYFKLPVESR